jgi:glyoxylase-like metal-dependent hydrolase (beta-lactamase superfamily II)
MIQIKEFFDKTTYTLTYVVWDPSTKDAVVIDPVWDYDPASSTVSEESLMKLCSFIDENLLNLHFVLETHAHADHLSSAQLLKQKYPSAKVAMGGRITEVQTIFKTFFDLGPSFKTDGSQFDRLFSDGERFSAGSLDFETIYTPGHTPACSSYKIEDALFTGDTLFMPDYGVGRCDFPAGSAEALYESITTKLYSLPDTTRVFTGHDYQPNGRTLRFQSTIGEEKKTNIQMKEGTSKESFVKFRKERDKTLKAPNLLLPSVQVNIDAGHLPEPHANGRSYLASPVLSKP